MSEVRQRTVRLHAVREGDEFYFDSRWWIVKAHDVKSGDKFKGFDKEGNERVEEIQQFNPERSCALWIVRGRRGTVIIGPKVSTVKIIRRNHG